MNYTTNFNLNKPEGTDLYNHLTIDNPNMDTIDAAMQANKLASVGNATELVSGTLHAITRSDSNQNIFRFKATGDFKAGDTITVDGVSVNAYTTAGQALPDDAYVLSAEVICILDNTSLWVFTNKTSNTYREVVSIPANTYATLKETLDALKVYFDTLTTDEQHNSSILLGDSRYDAAYVASNLAVYSNQSVNSTTVYNRSINLINGNSEAHQINVNTNNTINYMSFAGQTPAYVTKLITF